jgi:tetratricopeptide (TPR) repeat protein
MIGKNTIPMQTLPTSKDLQYYDDAIANNPSCTYFYRRKAKILEKMNRREETLRVYDDAPKQDPDSLSVYFDKAILLAKMGQNEEALKACDQGPIS